MTSCDAELLVAPDQLVDVEAAQVVAVYRPHLTRAGLACPGPGPGAGAPTRDPAEDGGAPARHPTYPTTEESP
jgi:hypothetical protein